jgi:hypothetical protein
MSNKGAEFRKTDLQIHSPRDNGWKGARPEIALTEESSPDELETLRETFCRSFIEKCIREGLKAIAITDHHEGVYAYKVIETLNRLQAETESIDLWVFPGMELTCRDSCQALIIFDASLPMILFEKARAKLNLLADVSPYESQGIQVNPLNHNIEDLQALLEADTELRGKFIILPHVKPRGYKTVLREGFHKRFNELPYVGGYMDKCYPHELEEGDQKILNGEIPAWSSEKRGVICTSDSRYADFRLIGKHATWIKLASPTAESIRQAMLAPDSRILYEEPHLPSVVINSMTVRGSRYLKDGKYFFNQQMNSIIGGRGAGKSTLLEYIRFALGCCALDDTISVSSAVIRLREILEGTLDSQNGGITLEVLLNGASMMVTRQMTERSVIKVEAEGAENLSTVEDIRRLIPTQQYRQGELSDLAHSDAEKRLLNLITGQATQSLSTIEGKLRKNAQTLSETLAKAVRLSAAGQAHAYADTQVKILQAQIENLTKQLKLEGQVSTQAISDHDKYLRQQSALASARDFVEKNKALVERNFGDMLNDLKQIISDQPIFTELPELEKAFTSLRNSSLSEGFTLTNYRNQIIALFDQRLDQISKAEKEWAQYQLKHQEDYEEQKKSLAGKQLILESIEQLREQERAIVKQLETAISEESELRDADVQLNAMRLERRKLGEELSIIVSEQIVMIEAASSGLAHGQLASEPNLTEVMESLRKGIDLPNLRKSRLETILSTVNSADNKSAKWIEIQDEILSLLRWKEGAPAERSQPPETPILQNALENAFMEKLRERISLESVSVILTAIVRPRVEIFHIRDGKLIEFRKASQGEQAATLLNILMNQSNGPLIIDQPEEDLDNKIINDIIKTIRTAKSKRQLILATHNANITVNGDSENVIELALGKQGCSGAIDEHDVRKAITETMEGGKVAFELRRKKYNF